MTPKRSTSKRFKLSQLPEGRAVSDKEILEMQYANVCEYLRNTLYNLALCTFKKQIESGSKVDRHLQRMVDEYGFEISNGAYLSPSEMLHYFLDDIRLLKQRSRYARTLKYERVKRRSLKDHLKLFRDFGTAGTTADVGNLFNIGRRTAIRWVEERRRPIKRRGETGRGKKPILLKDVIAFAEENQFKPYIGEKCAPVAYAYKELRKQGLL